MVKNKCIEMENVAAVAVDCFYNIWIYWCVDTTVDVIDNNNNNSQQLDVDVSV